MKVIDFATSQELQIMGDWRTWLVLNGYGKPPVCENSLTLMEIQGLDGWAVYHPPVGKLTAAEILYVNIPTEQEADALLRLSATMIQGCLATLAGIQIDGVEEKHVSAPICCRTRRRTRRGRQ